MLIGISKDNDKSNTFFLSSVTKPNEMHIEEFIHQKEFDSIALRLKAIEDDLQLNSYNLFTLSSYNSHLENFHSDVIALLLDQDERHKQNDIFLKLFLDYLITRGAMINKDDYVLCEVTREKGRIDIWIKDNTSRKSIIIENKINNASDRDNQLTDYYQYAIDRGFTVDAIVYITLNGFKSAPLTENLELNKKFVNVSASSANQDDLVNGWLDKCYHSSKDEDNRSFIYQYLKLIKHLSKVGMNRQIKDDFYQVVARDGGFEQTKAIAELFNHLQAYRAELFNDRINDDYYPFTKKFLYRPNHWLYERFQYDGKIFKIDIHFNVDGSARIDFWNPNQPEETQRVNSTFILEAIGVLPNFQSGGFGGGLYRKFTLEQYKSIAQVDNEIVDFTRLIFHRLRILDENGKG